jgi:hypothetical protein
MTKSVITLRFKNWGHSIGVEESEFFRILLEKALDKQVKIIDSQKPFVDVQIESFYNDKQNPENKIRAYRFIKSNLPGGINFGNAKFSPNQQPARNSRFSIFYTGENVRPPEGRWDAYLSFDLHSFDGRNAYLPLWWLTSTDMLFPKTSPYLGKSITLEEMLRKRNANYKQRKKFCVAFIGKAYPFRMHALTALSKIGKIDVFGAVARNNESLNQNNKYEISQKYRFIFAFENDLYPGYVTEKAPEAWATGAVPLYWGMDPAGYLNQRSLINLSAFNSLEDFAARVKEVNNSQKLWEKYASEPFLQKTPNLKLVIKTIRNNLKPLL